MLRRSRHAARPRLECLEQRRALATLTPSLLKAAYGIDSIRFANGAVKGTGAGQTIAVIGAYHTPTLLADFAAFNARYGLPALTPASSPARNGPAGTAPGSIGVYNLAGSATDPNWGLEAALDVQWAHAVAPGANIIVVEAASASVRDLMEAVNGARGIPGVSAITMSWGTPEFAGQRAYDGMFTTPPGHTGITFLASSGDSGAGAEWPASSPNVVSVGGTSLNVSEVGIRQSETSWSGSGGGLSRFVPRPAYQASVQSSDRRSGPDVAAVADPGTGVLVVSGGLPRQVGGTSLSSPIWAGLIAIADQGLALAGKGSLDGPTQALPRLYAAPAGSFTDVTTGPGSRAARGYDFATGLGVPNARNLVAYLANGTTHFGGGVASAGVALGGGPIVGGAGATAAGSPTTPISPPRPAPRWQPRFRLLPSPGAFEPGGSSVR